MSSEQSIPKTAKLWILCFGLASLVTFLMYDPEHLKLNMFWFGTVLALSVFAFELLGMAVAIVLLQMFYLAFSISTPNVVFSGWLAPVPWMCFNGMLIGILMDKTNLARRIALLLLSKIAKTPIRLFVSFYISGLILGALIPDIITNLIIFMTIASSICKSLELDKGSKESATIIMAAFFGSAIACANYLPNNTGLIGLLMLQQSDVPIEFSWVTFFIENMGYCFIHIIIGMSLLYFFGNKALKPHIEQFADEAKSQLATLGALSKDEKKTLVLTLAALLGFILEPLHGLPGYFLFGFIIFIGFTPLFNLLKTEDITKVNYPILLFIVGCMSIGFVAAQLGVHSWLSSKIVPILQSIEYSFAANVFSYFTGVLANFILTPVAAASSLSVPMAQIALDLGIGVKPILYSFLYGLDQFVLPYELAPALIMFSTGYARLKYVIIIMTLRLFLVPLGIIFSSFTLWPMLGL